MSRIKYVIALSVAALTSSNASAVLIATPIDYTTANLVGTAEPTAANSNASVPEVRTMANTILALGAGVTSGIYQTHDTDDYTGTVSGGVRVDTGNLLNILAGWEYVMAKYNGQNAGFVLFYLGGEASTIPEFSNNIWANNTGNGYQISGYTLFNSVTRVPEPETLSLLGTGLLILGFGSLRRRRRA